MLHPALPIIVMQAHSTTSGNVSPPLIGTVSVLPSSHDSPMNERRPQSSKCSEINPLKGNLNSVATIALSEK